MTTWILWIVAAAVFFVSWFVSAAALWGFARLARIAATYRGALGIVVLACLCGYVILAGSLFLLDHKDESPAWLTLLASLAAVLLRYGIPWLWLVRRFRAPKQLALGLTFATLGVEVVVNIAVALMIRTWVTEAFRVPTGAMAMSIQGAYVETTCRECGCTYTVSASRLDPAGGFSPQPLRTRCASCLAEGTLPARPAIQPGDRIVCDKLVPRRRWDAVVFKYPEDPKVNYVMRLVGLPGERIDIAGGDLFVDGRREAKPAGSHDDCWRPEHDTRFVAASGKPPGNPWRPAAGAAHWTPSAAGGWSFSSESDGVERLEFARLLVDRLAYNPVFDFDPDAQQTTPTGDVRVQCDVAAFSGEGTFSWTHRFRGAEVIAKVGAAGDVKLAARVAPSGLVTVAPHAGDSRKSDTTSEVSATGHIAGGVAGHRVSFAFRDGLAWVAVDGEVVAQLEAGPQQFLDSVLGSEPDDACALAIEAAHCSLELTRIQVERDVYYRTAQQMGMLPDGPTFTTQWKLGEHEHIFLGDNSSQSKDSRFWGPAHTDALVGRVRYVYWPKEHWHGL